MVTGVSKRLSVSSAAQLYEKDWIGVDTWTIRGVYNREAQGGGGYHMSPKGGGGTIRGPKRCSIWSPKGEGDAIHHYTI